MRFSRIFFGPADVIVICKIAKKASVSPIAEVTLYINHIVSTHYIVHYYRPYITLCTVYIYN